MLVCSAVLRLIPWDKRKGQPRNLRRKPAGSLRQSVLVFSRLEPGPGCGLQAGLTVGLKSRSWLAWLTGCVTQLDAFGQPLSVRRVRSRMSYSEPCARILPENDTFSLLCEFFFTQFCFLLSVILLSLPVSSPLRTWELSLGWEDLDGATVMTTGHGPPTTKATRGYKRTIMFIRGK